MPSTESKPLHKEERHSLWAIIFYILEPLCRDTPPAGYCRIRWTSPFGKPLYMDIKARLSGETRMIEDRFAGRSSESTPTSPDAQSSPLDKVLAQNRFLQLVVSTRKGNTLKEIHFTDATTDRELFTRIRNAYREVKDEEAGCRLLRWLFGGFSPFKLTEVEFVSFSLKEIAKFPRPVVIESPALPPEKDLDVRRNWLSTPYSPVPNEADYFKFSKAFLAQLKDPRHAMLGKVWSEVLPKKLNTELAYEPEKFETAWGVQIKEGLDSMAVFWILILFFLAGWGGAAAYAARTGDSKGALCFATWLIACSTLIPAYLQLK